MKKISLLLIFSMLLALLAGCGQRTPETAAPEPEQAAAPEGPELLQLDTLAVELPRSSLPAQQLTDVVKTLPDLLKTWFNESGWVEVETVTVTVGSSPAATAQALAEGHIDLAFLTAEEFLEYGGGAAPLFADAQAPYPAADYQEAGTTAVICAAPTVYGEQLFERNKNDSPLTWEELKNARWGVSEAGAASDSFDLWLADNYDGSRAAELPQVTLYEDDTALLEAALEGELDALVLRREGWELAADAWTLDTTQTSAYGIAGFGRDASMEKEIPVLAETETLCSRIAAVAPEREELTQQQFTAALEQVLEHLSKEKPELTEALGLTRFTRVTDGDLDSARRLLALKGKSIG